MNRFFILALVFLGIQNLAIGQSSSSGDGILLKFKEYRKYARDAAFLDYPDETRDEAKKKSLELKGELLNDPKLTESLIAVFTDTSASDGQRVDVINFFAMTKVGKNEILSITREIVKESPLDKDPAPLLSASATYLYDFGDKSDIELLERLKDHVNPSFVWLANYGIKKLKSAKGDASAKKSSATQEKGAPTPEPAFSKKPTPAKRPTKAEVAESTSDNPFPWWVFIIGGVVVVGLVVVLRRK